jgi:O-antigen ligase
VTNMEENEGKGMDRLYGFLFVAILVTIFVSILLFAYLQKGLDGFGELASGFFLLLIWFGAVTLYQKLFKKQGNLTIGYNLWLWASGKIPFASDEEE